jgi:hypothetical protein
MPGTQKEALQLTVFTVVVTHTQKIKVLLANFKITVMVTNVTSWSWASSQEV